MHISSYVVLIWLTLSLGEVYEYATLISVEKQDIQEFERNMSILKTYYDEFQYIYQNLSYHYRTIIPESQKKYTVLGLYLLYLLAYNKYKLSWFDLIMIVGYQSTTQRLSWFQIRNFPMFTLRFQFH